jgi:hypothetical protein
MQAREMRELRCPYLRIVQIFDICPGDTQYAQSLPIKRNKKQAEEV